MLEIIKDIIKKIPDRDMKIHRTREFLQLLVLKILWDRGYFKNLAFCGGTCLRVLYGLRRFSEDLDFSLIKKEGYDFEHFLKGIIYDFGQIGFSLDIRKKGEKTVQSAMLKFKEILFALGLSDIKSEKLHFASYLIQCLVIFGCKNTRYSCNY